MTGLKKLPKEMRTRLGLGAILLILGFIWISVILFVLSPGQIQPTREDVQAASEAFMTSAGVPANLWSLSTVGEVIVKGAALLFLDIVFVVARYGGFTLLILGGYAVFEAISSLQRADR